MKKLYPRDEGFTSSWGRSWRCLQQPILHERDTINQSNPSSKPKKRKPERTRGQALPQLFSLLRVLKGQGVQVPRASDLELGHRLRGAHGGDLLGGETGGGVGVDSDGGLLYSSGWRGQGLVSCRDCIISVQSRSSAVSCVSSSPLSLVLPSLFLLLLQFHLC